MSSSNRADPDDRPGTDMDRDQHDERVDHDPNPSERGKWVSALIAVLGLWMIIQAVGFDLEVNQFWGDILIGALLVAVGGYNFSRRASERFGNTAVALIAVVAGLWLIASPFLLGDDTFLTETSADLWAYNDFVVGVLATGLGAYSAYQSQNDQEDIRRTNA